MDSTSAGRFVSQFDAGLDASSSGWSDAGLDASSSGTSYGLHVAFQEGPPKEKEGGTLEQTRKERPEPPMAIVTPRVTRASLPPVVLPTGHFECPACGGVFDAWRSYYGHVIAPDNKVCAWVQIDLIDVVDKKAAR